MKIRITLATKVNGRYEQTGAVVDTDKAQAERLFMLGWAEKVVAEKKKASKKATK